jgi:hypothetical protein
MDPIANIKHQRELVKQILTAGDQRRATVANDEFGNRRTWASAARELAELVQALDEWRLKGRFDPYVAERDIAEVQAQAQEPTRTGGRKAS